MPVKRFGYYVPRKGGVMDFGVDPHPISEEVSRELDEQVVFDLHADRAAAALQESERTPNPRDEDEHADRRTSLGAFRPLPK